jgi:hypothetical protein
MDKIASLAKIAVQRRLRCRIFVPDRESYNYCRRGLFSWLNRVRVHRVVKKMPWTNSAIFRSDNRENRPRSPARPRQLPGGQRPVERTT